MRNKYIKFISITVFLALFWSTLPGVSLIYASTYSSTSINSTSVSLELPENFSQAKNFIIPLLKKLPQISLQIFDEQVKPIWGKMTTKAKAWVLHYWYSYLKPKIQILINKIKNDLTLKLKKREPQIRENFQKQKKILYKDVQKHWPGLKKSLWRHLRDILKNILQ